MIINALLILIVISVLHPLPMHVMVVTYSSSCYSYRILTGCMATCLNGSSLKNLAHCHLSLVHDLYALLLNRPNMNNSSFRVSINR